MMPFNGAVFALDGILIGAGDTRFLMWGMLAAAAVYVPIALLTLHNDWGIVGIWWGLVALIAVRLVTCAARFAGITLGVDRSACLTTLSAPMTRRIALITSLLVLALAAPAGAQSGAFGPLPARRADADADGRDATSDTGETGRNVLFIIGGALILGFGVMGCLILRDARDGCRRPAMAGPRVAKKARIGPTPRPKKKMRQKTRAQKQARKAHRKR